LDASRLCQSGFHQTCGTSIGHKQLLPCPIEYYLKKIYYDCNNAEKSDILHAASVVGIEHLLTGSDFPWTDDASREVLGQLDGASRTKLAYDNAASLFSMLQ
jgi:hypothetical protein